MTKRRVTIVVPRYLPHLGGIENHVAELATSLQAMGHEVVVATQTEGDTRSPRHEQLANGLIIRRFRSGLTVKGQGLSPALWLWVRRGAGGADVVHVQNFHALTTLAILAVAKRPLIFTPHYLGAGVGSVHRIVHRTYAWLMRRAMRKVTRVICVSSSERGELDRDVRPIAPCVVIPNGVDEGAIRAATPAPLAGPLLVVAGRLEPYKQPDLVLEALARLPADYCLVIIGSGPLLPKLRDRVGELGLSCRVTLTGKLPAAELYSYYRAADVVVSMSGRECFGLTIAEGLAAGASIVASDIGAHRDVVSLAAAEPPQAVLASVHSTAAEVAAAVLAAGRRSGVSVPRLPDWRWVAAETVCLYENAVDASKRGEVSVGSS